MADSTGSFHGRIKKLAPLWIFLPGTAVAVSLLMHNASWTDIWRFACLTIATTSFSYCISSCMTRSVRMVEFSSLLKWCEYRDFQCRDEWDRCKDLLVEESRSRTVYFATTVATGFGWYTVVLNHCEQVTGDLGNPLIAAIATCFASGLSVWKVFENGKSKPVGVQFAGEEFDPRRVLEPSEATVVVADTPVATKDIGLLEPKEK